jgi:hypothetical protein
VKNAEWRIRRARHRERVLPRAAYCHVLVDHKFGTSEGDGLPVESRSEIDAITIMRISKRLPQ